MYIENSKELRAWLESNKFFPLRFYMNKKYLFATIGTGANARGTWKDHFYYTFDEKEEHHGEEANSIDEFKNYTLSLI